MNMQSSLIQELMLYEFKLGHEATKNICENGEGTFNHTTETRWFKKFSQFARQSDKI